MNRVMPRALSFLLLVVPIPGKAAGNGSLPDAASRGWTCSLCPAEAGDYGQVDLAGLRVSDASPRFGDYRGLDQAGNAWSIGGTWRRQGSGGRFLDVQASRLGIDNRRIAVRTGRRGRYAVFLDYQEIPRHRGFGTRTVFRESDGLLALPEGWVPADRTSGMTALAASLRPADLALERKLLQGGVSLRLSSRWSWGLNLEHQRKQGTRPFGAGVFLLNASHLPVPVDFSTQRVDTRLEYSGESAHWHLAYARSEFDNHEPSVTWANPFSPLPGTQFLRASLEPDNRWQQAVLAGIWSPTHRVRLSARAAAGAMRQDEELLPASVNPDFSDIALPRASAAAAIDVHRFTLSGNLDARLTPRLSLVARWRRDERNNRTPVDWWTPVITDFVLREPRQNRPYSFTRERANLAFRYRLPGATRIQAGVLLDDHQRTLQSTDTTRETGAWGELALRPTRWLDARLRLDRSRRAADHYLQPEDGGPVDHPLLRKFHLADRDSNRRRLDLDFKLSPGLTLSARYQDAHMDYEHAMAGLQRSETRSLNLDATVQLDHRVQVHAFLGKEWIDSTQGGIDSTTLSPWQAATRDAFDTAGGGMTLRATPRMELRLDLVRANATGDIAMRTGGSTGAFSPLRTRLWRGRLDADFRLGGPWALHAWVEYERYDSSDWALDGFGPDGTAAVLGLGSESPDYDVAIIGLQARYRF